MPEDGLPSHICYSCTDKLESAYKFKLQVEQADSMLRERLDSLNMKEELFFSDVDVNLSSHRNDVEEITEESLLLKDHMDLLNVQKITEQGDVSQSQDIKEEDTEKHNNEDLLKNEQPMQIQSDEEQQIQRQVGEAIEHMSEEHHHQSFETQELQEIMFKEISHQKEIQEALNHTQHLAMHEHNYVAEVQSYEVPGQDESNIAVI